MQADVYQAFQVLNEKLDTIILKLNNVLRKERQMAVDLSALQAEVERDRTVDESAKTLLEGLTAKINELIAASGNTVDPAALQALVDSIKSNTDNLAAAVSANTPAG